MSIILDLIVVAIVIFFIALSAKKGFVKTVVEMIGFIAAIILAFTISTPLAGVTYDKIIEPPILSAVSEETTDDVQGIVNDIWEKMPAFITNRAEDMGHSQGSVTDSITAGLTNGTQAAVKGASQNIFRPVAVSLLGLIFSIIIAIVLLLLVKPLAKIINGLFSFSVIGKANRVLGGVVGLLKGIVFAVVFCMIISLIVSFTENGFLIFTAENVNNSYIFRSLANIVPFINF